MGKVNVLLVEDESIVAKDIQLSLKRLGYNVLGIENTGEKAITSARKLDPDIIIMDIMLKGKKIILIIRTNINLFLLIFLLKKKINKREQSYKS